MQVYMQRQKGCGALLSAECLVSVNDCMLGSLTELINKLLPVQAERDGEEGPSREGKMVYPKCSLMRGCQSNEWNNCSGLIKIILG